MPEITEVTRRRIGDWFVLGKVSWSGHLDEVAFLGRLYDLETMPSHDRRYKNAGEDIRQHRIWAQDWENDWLFEDPRFGLLTAPDEEFLKFLCLVVDPIVQRDAGRARALALRFNEILAPDGWELQEASEVSGLPVFAPVRTLAGSHALQSARTLQEQLDSNYVARQIGRMQSFLVSDPEAAIGAAKEFLETVCRTILTERESPQTGKEELSPLVKQTTILLELIPPGMANETRAKEAVTRLISSLGNLPWALAELRNLFGTGHGKEAGFKGLSLPHARLAVGTATALGLFLFETHRAEHPIPSASFEEPGSSPF